LHVFFGGPRVGLGEELQWKKCCIIHRSDSVLSLHENQSGSAVLFVAKYGPSFIDNEWKIGGGSWGKTGKLATFWSKPAMFCEDGYEGKNTKMKQHKLYLLGRCLMSAIRGNVERRRKTATSLF